jgi:hypothetical protein
MVLPTRRSTSHARLPQPSARRPRRHAGRRPEREALEAAQRAIWQARDVVLADLDKPTRPQGKRAKAPSNARTEATQTKAAVVPAREWLLPANAKKARARERAQLLAALRAGLAERHGQH